MAPDTATVDDVFRALADPGRRTLLGRLHTRNGQNLRGLCAGLDMARQSVSKHLAILEAAGLDTDWQPGSAMVWENQGVRIDDPDQVVLESDPFRRLAYTWHTFTPELAAAVGFSAEQQAAYASEPRSKVTFEIEDQPPMVK